MRAIVTFATGLALASCGDGDTTGTYVDQSPDELVHWSKNNLPVSEATWAGVAELICRPAKGSACGPNGCKESEPGQITVWSRWKPNSGKYYRCGGGTDCDEYDVTTTFSGAYANLGFPGRAMFAKVTASGEFTEVVSQMNLVIVYQGKCASSEFQQ